MCFAKKRRKNKMGIKEDSFKYSEALIFIHVSVWPKKTRRSLLASVNDLNMGCKIKLNEIRTWIGM